MLSDEGRHSRGYSLDSSRSSCQSSGSKGSKHRQERKGEECSTSKTSDHLDVEPTTSCQSPRQKQLRIAEASAQPGMFAPSTHPLTFPTASTMSSMIGPVQLPPHDVMCARLNEAERRMEGISGDPSPPLSHDQRQTDTGL